MRVTTRNDTEGGRQPLSGQCAREVAVTDVRHVLVTHEVAPVRDGERRVVAVFGRAPKGGGRPFLGLAVVPDAPEKGVTYSRLLPADAPAPVAADTPVEALADLFARTPAEHLAVVDAAGGFVGVVSRPRPAAQERASAPDTETLHLQWQAVLRATTDGLCILTRDWRISYANQATREILCPDAESDEFLVGMDFGTFFPASEEFHEYRRWVGRAGAQPRSVALERRMRRRDGSFIWCSLSAVRTDPSQTVSGYVVTLSDLTARRAADEARRVAEKRYESLAQQSIAGVFMYRDGRLIYANERAREIAGYPSVAELLAETDPFAHVLPEELAALKARIAAQVAAPEGSVQFETRVRRPSDGRIVHVLVQQKAMSTSDGPVIIGMSLDITAQKEAERQREALGRLGLRLAGASTLSEVASIVSDMAAEVWNCDSFAFNMKLDGDRRYLRLLSLDLDESGAKRSYPPTEHDGFVVKTDDPLLRGRARLMNVEPRFPVKLPPWGNMTRLSASYILAPLMRDGEVLGYMSMGSYTPGFFNERDRDFLELIGSALGPAMERCRAESERARLVAAVEQGRDSVVITDAEWRIAHVNAAFEKLTGYDRAEVLGMDARKVPDVTDRGPTLRRAMEAVVARGDVWAGRLKRRRKDGTPYDEEARVFSTRDASGRVTSHVLVARDVTREEALESQTRQSQKMEAFGMLAGGIAHDFNSLLNLMQNYTHMLLGRMHVDNPDRVELEGIKRAIERGTDLTSQLLAFSRKREMRPQRLDLNRLVEGAARMFGRVMDPRITMSIRTGQDVPQVLGDPAQLEQVLMNLVLNARDAMPDGGELTIATMARSAAELAAEGVAGVGKGGFACVIVTDTGVGMDAETRNRVFEPFFTTKPPGRGTGLGLPTAYGIVAQSGGVIHVRSEPGGGSTFTVCLPALPDVTLAALESGRHMAVPATEGRGLQAWHGMQGHETVLVVDDDAEVRRLTSDALRSAGYKVLQARGTRHARELLGAHRGPLDLVVTGVVAAAPDGITIVELVRRHHPRARGLFMLGYADSVELQRASGMERAGFLQKPFSPDVLCQAVRELLDRPDKL